MDKSLLKDKAVFAVALMAAFLAFGAYKDNLSQIYIQMGSGTVSLSHVFLAFVIMLALSVYFYALDYLKYSIPRFQNSFVFKATSFLGSFFYTLAIFFPLLVFVFWVASGVAPSLRKYDVALTVFDSALGIPVVLISLFNAYSQFRRNRDLDIQKIDRKRIFSLESALRLFDHGFYNLVVGEVFKVIESSLSEKLLSEVQLYTEGMTSGQILNLAMKWKILDEETGSRFMDLRNMRNQATHAIKNFTKNEAQLALNLARAILGKLEVIYEDCVTDED